MAAGTGGVIAFVGVLVGAAELAGFRLRPRRPRGDARVAEVLRHSGWGVVLHTGAGLLLGTAIVAGGGVEGGVVAYQVGWVIFLAPYAVLAQPIHTAILPELVVEARDHGLPRVAASLRWALERMAVLVVPATAGMVALAEPAMRLVSFGDARGEGSEVLAAAVAGLALGLLPYSAFLLLARGLLRPRRQPHPRRGVGGVRAGGRRRHGHRLGHGRRLGPHLRARPRPLGRLRRRCRGAGRGADPADRRLAVAGRPRPHRRRVVGRRPGGVVGRRISSSMRTRAGRPTWWWWPASGSSGPG